MSHFDCNHLQENKCVKYLALSTYTQLLNTLANSNEQIMQLNAIQHNTVQLNEMQCSTMQINTVQKNTKKFIVMQHNATQ